MTTVQIIGIAVAALAVLLLIIALIVTRRRGEDAQDASRSGGSSFLDEAPQDTFTKLGKAEQPVEDITIDPAVERAAAAQRTAASAAEADRAQREPERPPQPGGLGLDWGPDLSVRQTASPDDRAEPQRRDPDAAVTGEPRPDEPATLAPPDAPPAPEGESGDRTAPAEPAEGAEGGPAGDVTPEPGPGRLVPLSDIIVTTSAKTVDLDDPEVRRMLTELVTFEIDQAADFRRQGQTIDAVLQLTEAEKVSRALGMTESAQRIRAMMEEIRGG
jgi:hypothetical protein